MKFCSNCGTELLPNTNFCPSCGNKIGSSENHISDGLNSKVQDNLSTNRESIQPTSNANGGINNTGSKSPKNDGSFTATQKKLLIGSVIVFFVVIVFIIGYKSTGDSDERPTADSGLSNTYIDESGAVVPFDSAAAIEEELNSAQSAAITEKNIQIRNNWEDYIIVSRSGFKYSELGGISDLSIIVTNKTEYLMDRVYVDVDIKTANGYIHKTEHLFFEQIKPFSRQELMVPSTTRGKTVEYRITNIYSNSLNFKWDEGDHTGNGSLNDPWKTND